MTTRRDLLRWMTAMAALSASRAVSASEKSAARIAKPLDILFLGGTGFIGPLQVADALSRGHHVTLFNRGKSAPGLFGDRVEMLLGNRDTNIAPGLSALQGERRWDVVIDNSGYVPRHVRDSIELLKDRVDRYVYISTVAVYEPTAGPVFTESSPLRAALDPPSEDASGANYGPLKAECDRIVQAALGRQATIIRPTFLFGPGDDTDRFTYWVERVSRGGEVLGPAEPQSQLQWVDARDLGPWIVTLAERDGGGIFNAAGPRVPTVWEQVLHELAKLATAPVTFHWATAEVLEKTGIRLPLVRPASFKGSPATHFDSTTAMKAGLDYRPLAQTAADTLAWWHAQTAERRAQADGWPTPAQEKEALRLLAVAPSA